MLFHSPFFLFLFLPLILFLYFYTSKYSKSIYEYILVAAGIFFYAYWDILLSPILFGSIIFNFYFSKMIKERTDLKLKKKILIFAIIFNVLWLAIFKYTDFIIQNLNILFDLDINEVNLPFPLAISFVTFQTIAYLVDCYKDKIEKNTLIRYSLFIIFFPQLIAGPIIRYHDIASELKNRIITRNLFAEGLVRFIRGLAKKVIIANSLALIADQTFDIDPTNLPTAAAWLGIICYTLQIYFDFSGYSDMAIGLGKMLGFNFKENFNYPYISKSIKEFWKRWHISLSTWFKDYLYIPEGQSRSP